MKLPQLLALVCCSIVVVLSEITEPNEQELLARASAQLERLAPYRRIVTDQGISDEQWQFLENVAKDTGTTKPDDGRMAFEIYRILPENLQKDVVTRIGGNRALIELLANPKYMAMMQERIKRSGAKGGYGTKRDGYSYEGYEGPPDGGHPPEGYGGYAPDEYAGGEHYGAHPPSSGSDSGGIIKGSASLIGGIAKGIIGGLVSASGSASKGSSSISAQSSSASSSSSSSSSGSQNKPEYGHVYSYGDKAFDVWDFKKAIISTLMQAVKAISGGVIALKGQLIKGSGYLVSSKGKIITSTGDAITSLGRNIAKSTVHKPEPPHHGYAYDHPPEGGHESYDGPPPNIEEYSEPSEEYHGNSNYESPSEDDDHAGLLIMKPTKTDDHDDHHEDSDSQKPPTTHPEDNYHGPPPGLGDKDIEHTIKGTIEGYQNLNHGNQILEGHHHSPDRPLTSYDVSYHHSLDDHKNGQDYQAYPPQVPGSPVSLHGPLSIQQSIEYPPINIRYKLPGKGSLDLPNGDTSSNDLSVYSSFSIDTSPDVDSIKTPLLNHGGGYELSKLQPHANFHNLPMHTNAYPGAALHGPLKIPLMNPYLTPHWQNQGLLQPIAGFDMHGLYRRRNSAQRRRSVSDVAHRMRLHRV